MRIRAAGPMLIALATTFGLFMTTEAVAKPPTAAFVSEPLDVMNYANFLQSPRKQYDLAQSLEWQITSDPKTNAFLAQDFEVRIFVVGPPDSLTPRPWTTVANCDLYLSLVFPIRAERVRQTREIFVTSLDNDVRWLSVVEGAGALLGKKMFASRSYIAVFEPKSADQSPGLSDYDELGGRYEFISIDRSSANAYFARGLPFTIVLAFGEGVVSGEYATRRDNEARFFDQASKNVVWHLNCYHASSTYAANPSSSSVAPQGAGCPLPGQDAGAPGRAGPPQSG